VKFRSSAKLYGLAPLRRCRTLNVQGMKRDIIPNNLWLARKKRGFPQKWVASLLGHRSTALVSQYENGVKMPVLFTAAKFQAIYQTPLAELYPGLFAEASAEVGSAKRRHPYILRRENEYGCGVADPGASPPNGRP
jgi:transcriptional regulator with XRE-family HTH domain